MLNCFVVLSLILPRSISTVSSGTETMWSSSGEWCCQRSWSHVSVFQIYSQWRSPHHSVPDSRYQPTLSLISCWPGLCSRNGVARLLQSHSHCPGQCEVRGWRRIQVWSVSGSSQVLHSSQNNSSTSCWWVSRHCSCDSCITSDLPASAPAIYGLRSVYGEGEFVNLTCESGPSSPVTRLSWSLNNVRIQPESPLVSTMLPVYPLPDKKGISRTFLSLLVTEETFLK